MKTYGILKEEKQRYSRCVSFAAMYNSTYRYDIVHDAWLYYFCKTGEDLFKKPLNNSSSYLFTVVKKAFYRWYYRERVGPNYIYSEAEDLVGTANPHEVLIAKETYENFYNIVYENTKPNENRHFRSTHGRELPMKILELTSQGYDQISIGDQLGVSKQVVNLHIKQIKQTLTNAYIKN